MNAPDWAKKLAQTTKANRSKERKAEEQIASAVQESAAHRELWDANASDNLEIIHGEECGFSDALGQISKHMFKPSVVAVSAPQASCPLLSLSALLPVLSLCILPSPTAGSCLAL